MLEQARFSLSRAGVMVGLSALLFLSTGIWFNTQQSVSDVYFSEQTWDNAQTLLRHIKPDHELNTNAAMSISSTCSAGQKGYPQLLATATQLDTELARLTQLQFVRQTYKLDLANVFMDGFFLKNTCEEIQKNIQWVLRRSQQSNTVFLQNLYWRERMQTALHGKLQSNPWVALPKSMLSMKSPWSGINGCIYGTDAQTGAITWLDSPGDPSAHFCKNQLGSDLIGNARAVNEPLNLPSLAVIVQSLGPWRLPQHTDHHRFVEIQHSAVIRGSEQSVGLHTQLSIDTKIQNSLQRLVSCYTARSQQDCPMLATKGEGRYENARVRMAGLALIDIPTGKVLAAVSSESPCFLHDLTRTGKLPPDCPDLPLGTVHKPLWPQAPDNHALFKQAAPGSLVKPLLMSGILADGGKYAGLDTALQKSDSHLFLDAWLCRKDLGKGPFSPDCDRPKRTQHIAHLLGWNNDCEINGFENPKFNCGEIDLLWGYQSNPATARQQKSGFELPNLPVMSGRILVKSVQLKDQRRAYQDLNWPQGMPSAAQRADCANSNRKAYTGCSGNRLGIVSEGYGQGNALTTPVGVSGLLSALANASYQRAYHPPHLLVNIFRNDGRTVDWGPEPHSGSFKNEQEMLDPVVARKVIAAMSLTHKPNGTANNACTGVWTANECSGDLGIAGKTGTPGDADNRSIVQLKTDMQQRSDCLQRKDTACLSRFPLPRPRYRWYAAIFKSGSTDQYDKALTVLVHSNWRQSDGRFADDQNAAAEIGMQAIRLLRVRGE